MSDLLDENYTLVVTVLEDLHTGTGTGNITVDAVQAKDENGHPVIDRHHFRGVLKDNALRLKALGCIEEDDINILFGKSGEQQRRLDCSSLVSSSKDCLINWDSTAIKENSRCTEDNSLRRIEYIKAGTLLSGTISLEQVTKRQQESFDKVLNFTTRLGSDRTRGSGQIKISKKLITDTKKPATEKVRKPTVRLLLKNTEPLCVPVNGYAGNINRTESYVPGRTLFAAICTLALKENNDQFKKLFSADLRVGNAYPIPQGYQDKDISRLKIGPMPSHIHSLKQQASNKAPENIFWPHWAKPQKEISVAPLLRSDKDINIFTGKSDNKTSRPKDAVYLFQDETNIYRRYYQKLTIRMRNERGGPLAQNLTNKDTNLFSEQRIPANTHFLMDIKCDDAELLNKILSWLALPQAIKIGRSKAPVSVISQKEICGDRQQTDDCNSITIVATSDWILRGPNLGYLTELNRLSLLKAFGIKSPETYESLVFESMQETETQGGFNFATRLPRRPFEVIKRGSVFKFGCSKNLDGSDLLNKLSQEFGRIDKPIGDRIREGYGQFCINSPINIQSHKKILENRRLEQDKKEKDRQEKERIQEEVSAKEERIKKIEEDKKVKQEAVAYYESIDTGLKTEVISLELSEWHTFKKELLAVSGGSTFLGIISGNKNKYKKIDELFYKGQGGNNLEQKLNASRFSSHSLSVFLNTLENLIFKAQ